MTETPNGAPATEPASPITILQRAVRQLTERLAAVERGHVRGFRTSESLGKLIEAQAKASLAFEPIVKDKVGNIQGKEGRQGFSYAYASLDAVISATRKGLADNGLVFLQIPTPHQAGVNIVSLLMHSSGEFIEGELPMAVHGGDPKALGSAISYGRRYAMCSMLGISPSDEEEDDGDAAGASNRRAPAASGKGGGTGRGQAPAGQPRGPANADVERAFEARDANSLAKMLSGDELKAWKSDFRTEYVDLQNNGMELKPLDLLTKRAREMRGSLAWKRLVEIADDYAATAIKGRIRQAGG